MSEFHTSIEISSDIKSRKLFRISGETIINVSPQGLWEALIRPDHVSYFNSFVEVHKCKRLSKVGHKDSCVYYNGDQLYRELIKFEVKKQVRFKVFYKKNKDKNSFTTFELLHNDSGTNNQVGFRLTIESDAYRNVPRPIWHTIAFIFLIPSYKKYLTAVVKGMKYHCETGVSVTQNQFGYHSKFSKK